MEFVEVKVVMLMPSRGWFVGGEMKLLMENSMSVPAAREDVATFDKTTRDPEEGPVH